MEVTANNMKKKVALHRLSWMAYHCEVVPDGYDVNHKNGKKLAFPDAAHNVEILPSPVNRSRVLMGEW